MMTAEEKRYAALSIRAAFTEGRVSVASDDETAWNGSKSKEIYDILMKKHMGIDVCS